MPRRRALAGHEERDGQQQDQPCQRHAQDHARRLRETLHCSEARAQDRKAAFADGDCQTGTMRLASISFAATPTSPLGGGLSA
jgi:hypothetical protein